jgi:hypothetical protein
MEPSEERTMYSTYNAALAADVRPDVHTGDVKPLRLKKDGAPHKPYVPRTEPNKKRKRAPAYRAADWMDYHQGAMSLVDHEAYDFRGFKPVTKAMYYALQDAVDHIPSNQFQARESAPAIAVLRSLVELIHRGTDKRLQKHLDFGSHYVWVGMCTLMAKTKIRHISTIARALKILLRLKLIVIVEMPRNLGFAPNGYFVQVDNLLALAKIGKGPE